MHACQGAVKGEVYHIANQHAEHIRAGMAYLLLSEVRQLREILLGTLHPINMSDTKQPRST